MVSELYAGPPEEFVARRDELARSLAASGDADEASRVKGLRKPTVTAWTLNVVSREHPKLITALVSAHEHLRSAGSAAEVRTASDQRMTAIGAIVDAKEGVGDAVRKKMRSTLLAVATDPAAEELLVEGRLERELEPAAMGGFGLGEWIGEAPAPPGGEDSPKLRKAREKADRLGREADEAEAEAGTLREAADRAERLAADAEARSAAKRREADDAKRLLDA